jgi:hypothetical protein
VIEFTVSATTSASPEEVLAAARDFSKRRIEIWPNVSARGYEVHEIGDGFAEVTEKALQGFVWERSRYEWTDKGPVRQTVIDSNALQPGSTWEVMATPAGGGSEVEARFRREFKGTPKGLFGTLVNRFGQSLYGSDLKRMLKTLETGE